MNRISSNYEENVQWFNDVLGAGRSCDMVCRDLYVGGRRARFWVIDGFGGDAILERMGAFWLSLQPEAVQGLTEMQQFADRYVTFMEVNVSYDRDDIVTSVLMGKSLLVMEGLSGAALIDAKEYPSRSVGEPPDGKVLRGSHDGFIEAVVPNMAMLRRRIRDPHLTMEGLKVGQRTHSDVALCYLDDRVDHALLDELRHKLQNIQANSLTMAQESVAEAIRPKQWCNPFPKVRYTERPDTAAACVMEGSRPLLAEVQALAAKTQFGVPRRTAAGVDYNRMVLLLAILEKRCGLFLSSSDVYVNVVGGMRLDEPAVDLPMLLAIASSFRDKPLPEGVMSFGEVGLTGELRAVSNAGQRINEAYRLGFHTCVMPDQEVDEELTRKMNLVRVKTVGDAIKAVL